MSDRLSYLQWSALDKINHIVECKDVTMAQVHEALQLVRQHLEARIAQTAPTYVPGTELPYAPAVPDAMPEVPTELAGLF